MRNTIFMLCLLVSFAACGSKKKNKSDCRKCTEFSTQAEAKRYAKANKQCKNALDHDGDGRYCEDLPKE